MYTILFINRNEDGEELTVSVVAGWQKRGSGRSFDSLSGNIHILSGTLNGLKIILGKLCCSRKLFDFHVVIFY